MTLIEEMLKNAGSIAVIEAKNTEWKTAYKVPFYMYKHGFKWEFITILMRRC